MFVELSTELDCTTSDASNLDGIGVCFFGKLIEEAAISSRL